MLASQGGRYVLDTLTGGNFLGTPALEACNIIESLVGIPPANVTKTVVTLENIMEKLDVTRRSLPNMDKIDEVDKKLLDNTSKFDSSLEISMKGLMF